MNAYRRKRSLAALITVFLYLTGLLPGFFTASAQGQRINAPSRTIIKAPQITPVTPSQPGQQVCPEIMTLAPSMLAQGASVTMVLTGKGLDKIKAITLGTGVKTESLKIFNPTTAQVLVTADHDAPTGPHAVMVDAGSAALGVTAAGCGIREVRPRLQILPRSPQAPGEVIALIPDIISINPPVLNRGQISTLTLKTKNFSPQMGIDFGSGIQIISPPSRTGDATFTVGVKVATDAPLGKHAVMINKTKTATAFITVNQGQPAALPASPKPASPKPFTINTIVPNMWVQSISYKITLNGTGFADTMEVDFGEGVKQKGKLIIVNDAIAQAEVEITSDKIAPQMMGERHPKARFNQAAAWQVQPATISIYPLTKTTSGQAPASKGKIELREPSKFGQKGSPEFPNYYGAPLLHEGLVFKWEEKTPGVQAQYFELRILSKDGSRVIKRAIAPYTTYTVLEEFIYDLMMNDLAPVTAKAASTRGAQKVNLKTAKTVKQGQSQQGQSQQGQSQQTSPAYPQETQLLWEVAGYQVVTVSIDTVAPYSGTLSPDRISHIQPGGSSGNEKQLSGTLQIPSGLPGGSADPKKSPMSLQIVKSDADVKAVADMLKKEPVKKTVQVALEVEISNRWPLSMPDRPTGLACPATGIAKGSPNTIAFNPVGDKCVIDKETRKCKVDKNGNKIIDQSNYPGDRFRIGGKFGIDKAPYEIEDENGTVYNLVVDWGDPYPSDTPSTVTNMKVKIDQKKHSTVADGPAYGDDFTYTYTIPDLEHTYNHWGTFPVRIYLLPDNKMQSTDPALVTHAFDEAQGAAQSPFRKISSRAAEYMNKAAAGNNKKALDVGKYAYMIYCKVVDIREVEDWDANGPLHLEKIDVTGFPGHEPGKAGECMKGQQNPYTMKQSAAMGAPGAKKGASSTATTLKSSVGLGGAVKNIPKTGPSGEQYSCDSPFTVCGVATDCDDSLIGEGRIASYYGQGYAGVRWTRDNVPVRYAEHFVKASPSRSNLDRDPAKWPPIIKGNDDTIPNSGNLLGKEKTHKLYNVRVEAMALPKPSPGIFEKTVEKALDNNKLAASVTNYLSSASKGGKPVKLGYLSPNKTSSGNTPPVVYVNSYLQGAAVKSSAMKSVNLDTAGDPGLPAEVTSLGKVYKIVESDPNQLCRIKFPSTGGEFFSISGLQNNYVKSGNNYSGCGTMTVKMNRMVGATPEELPVVIKFQNWQIPDGVNVSSGDLDAAVQKPIKVPGASGTLDKITGKASGGKAAGNGVEATLSVIISDSLRMQGVEKPQEWKGLKAPISVDGDWYLGKQTLKSTFIGWSAFKVQSDNSVTFDFSKKESPGAVSASCKSGGNNPGWMGIHLGNGATLIPYTFEQVGKGWQAPKVSDWAIEDGGICGKVKTGAFDADLYDGSIHVDAIEAESRAGVFDATYKGMIARFPWINTELKGDTKLHWQAGGEKGLFFNLVGESPVLDYNVVKMQVKNLIFTQEENIGWTSRGDAQFNFFADGKPFDGFAIAKVFYDFAGKAYFAKGVTTGSMSRSGATRLSKTPLNLTNVAFDTAASGDNRFKFTFGTKLNLSKVMPVIDVPVTFAIKRQGAGYVATGPIVNPFKVGVGFPEVNPTVKVDINTMWTGAPAASGTAEEYSRGTKYAEAEVGRTENTVVSDEPSVMDFWRPGKMYAANMLPAPNLVKPVKSGYYLQYAANGPTPNDQFKGDVDMAMFGGPPVKAQFRLGYMGDNDYWIARVTIPLGPSGVPLAPPFLSLYALRGGLGYNFPISAFANDIYTAVPDISGNYMFMAGMRVGSPDGFAYMMDGDFSVNTAGYARMDYKAWLLSTSQEGNGNFHGFLQYGDGNFDGMLSGKISLLGDLVYMEIPENAATLHFGSDYWQINAGKKEGPRLNVHMLFADTNGFFQIGTPGVAFGGGLDFNLNAGIGRIHGYLDAGISISPAPRISGYAAGGVSAEICAFDVCVGPSIDVTVNISAPPAKASCHACVTIPIPLWNPEACGDFSL